MEILKLVDDGVKICKDKHSLEMKLELFINGEQQGWDHKSILKESLPQSWTKVVGIVTNYFTLDIKTTWVHGYHLAIINNVR